MKYGQLIECNMRNIFLEKLNTKWGQEISPRLVLLYAKLRAIEIYWN